MDLTNTAPPPPPAPLQFMDLQRNETFGPLICLAPSSVIGGGLWTGTQPLSFSIPLFLFQITIIVFTTGFTDFLLRPLRLPRYVSEVLSGLLLSPSMFGKLSDYESLVFPLRSVIVLETIAQLGMVYFIFTVGVEVDVNTIKRTGLKSAGFAMACSIVPATISTIAAVIIQPKVQEDVDPGAFVAFLSVVLSITAFSALARNLGELKLVGTEVARLALSTAVLTDSFAWAMLALSVTLSQWAGNPTASLWTILSSIAFFFGSMVLLKPVMKWVERRTPEGEELDETYACMLLVGVMVWAMGADAIGSHAIFGAFTYGLAVPQGPLGEAMIDMVEDFVAGLLLPLFFTVSGLRTNFAAITDKPAAMFIIFIVLMGAAVKVGASMLVAVVHQMPSMDGMSIGLLMSSKGAIELMVLNIAKDKHVLDNQTFALLIIMSLVITTVVTPLLSKLVKPSRRLVSYKRRTVQWPKSDSELRMVVCVNSPRNVPSVIALIDAANPTKRCPIFVYALHLVELTNRTSAMLIVNNTLEVEQGAKDTTHGPTNLGRLQTQSEQITAAFENYEQHAGGVSVLPLTAFSAYPTMHEDVCHHAEEKHAAIIVLPFHKQRTVDGNMEVMHPAIRSLNQNVLSSAPCSVGILIDRGLGGSAATRLLAPSTGSHRVMLLFFGGSDDREALAFTSRMIDHPNISLTVFRFIPYMPSSSSASSHRSLGSSSRHERVLAMGAEIDERERRLDDEHMTDFRRRCAAMGGGEVEYMEKVSRNTEETVEAIRQLSGAHDLYIVGRSQESPLTVGLMDWMELPELGPIGDFLASSDFAAAASVLVLQRSIGAGPEADALRAPDSPRQVRLYVNRNDHREQQRFSSAHGGSYS